MIRIRKADTRGRFRNGWLDAWFSFSFGGYRDPRYDGYSDLLVLNDDHVAPGGGFAQHGHADVEVMSYPISGRIEHRDSLGQVTRMAPGDVHLMRAGSGIRHSEMNASQTEPEHHLQWWIRPAQRGLTPAYARIRVPGDEKRNQWRPLATPEGGDGVLAIAQDARVFATTISAGAQLEYRPPARRWTFVHVVAGTLRMVAGGAGRHANAPAVAGDGDIVVEAGDGVFIEDEPVITLDNRHGARGPGEIVLFDLRLGAAGAMPHR